MGALLARARGLLAAHQVGGYLVGGFLRDALLGRPSRDLDLAVAGDVRDLAPELARLLGGRYVLLDEAHQLVARVVLPSGFQVDLTTLRGTIVEDLARRDFTIDALAMPLSDFDAAAPTIIDPLGGQQDLAAGVVRALAEESFVADPLRLLRGVRLAAELGFALDGETQDWMRRQAWRLNQVAPERVTAELAAILSVPGSAPWLRTLDELGVFGVVFPEMETAKGVSQPKEHHWNVFDHSVETVAAVEALLSDADSASRGLAPKWLLREALGLAWDVPHWPEVQRHLREEVAAGHGRSVPLKLAALLHDVAKPQAKTVEPSGRIRFFGHARAGAQMATAALERLRFSAKEVRQVAAMVEHHLRPGQLGDDPPTRRAVYRYFRDLGEAALDTLVLGLADHLATRGPDLDLGGWREHLARVEYLLTCYFEAPGVVSPPKLVDGHLVMERFGLAPGPIVGQLLARVREAQAQGEVDSPEEALDFIERELSWKP